MRATLRLGLAAVVLQVLGMGAAFAQSGLASGSSTGVDVGSKVSAALTDMVAPIIFVIALISFAGGLFFLAKGIIKLKDVASGQGRDEVGSAFLCIVAATCLICLPELAGVGMTTVFGDNGLFGNADLMAVQGALDSASGSPASGAASRIIGYGVVTPPQNCLSSAGAGGGVPAACMAQNLAMNAIPICVIAVFVFGFIVGLVVFASCIIELTKGESQQRSPGFWGKLLGSVLMMNAIYFFVTSSNTLLGNDQSTITTSGVNTSSSLLTYTSTGAGVLAQYAAIIGYCFIILTFFGAFAFLKGIFIIKEASEGRGQATYSHGLVFLTAGILLANAKYTTCIVLSTIAGGANTAGFC